MFLNLGDAPQIHRLKKAAVPSVFSWTGPTQVSEATVARQQRAITRSSTAPLQTWEQQSWKHQISEQDLPVAAEEIVESSSEEILCPTEGSINVPNSHTVAVQTTVSIVDDMVDSSTQSHLSKERFTYSDFVNDNKGIHYYTGLETVAKFLFVLSTLGPAVNCLHYPYGAVSLNVTDQFFLVLIKLRQYIPNFQLSRMFGISTTEVYNIFFTWIRFMSLQWREVSIWPSQEVVRFYAPTDFKNKFPTTRVIIDGTECPIKRPKMPSAQQSTFSTYKNKNTVKVVIGSTPGGLVSYVSPAFGGSTSDRQIVERSGLNVMCDAGDSVMADKGFNVEDLFTPYNIALNIPTFFSKKNRMSSQTVMKDRKISSKRIHIERIIGLGKTYKILSNCMNSTETMLSGDIIFVCYMLCNFRSGIVSHHA